jgi:hypothetical protein
MKAVQFVVVAVAALAIIPASPVHAQQASCHPVSPTDRVEVTTTDNAKVRGTVLCLTDQSLLLLRDGATSETPLAAIKKIETRSDPIWDGAVKGAAIPLVIWAIFCHKDCDAEMMFKSAATYGLIGATWDAVQRNTRTIYAGRPAASVAWRLRF